MSHRVVYVDAFTTKPFAGNPCAVVLEAGDLSEEQMLLIARETNQPETSFVSTSQEADFRVAYFTTRQRIPFAGHPTIATAFLLALEGAIRPGRPAVVEVPVRHRRPARGGALHGGRPAGARGDDPGHAGVLLAA